MSRSPAMRTSHYSVIDLDAREAHRIPALHQLLARCEIVDGRQPLGDHALNALNVVTAVEPAARAFTVADPSSRFVAYAQATPSSQARPTWTIDIAIDPSGRHDHATILDVTFGAVLDWVSARHSGGVQWWCHESTETCQAIAASHGLVPTRQLLEMHTHLGPTPPPVSITVRSFVTGVDETALLEVNNLAFARHPDQGSWTHDSLAGRFTNDWFDPAGLLVHVDHADDDLMLGFCWTKIHHAPSAPPVGEIYVVAVRPSHLGLGIGRALTQAGLASLHERHVDHVMLFVDGTNATARGLYRQLGFAVTSTSTAFHLELPERCQDRSERR